MAHLALALFFPLFLAPVTLAQHDPSAAGQEPGRLTLVVLDDDGNGIFKAKAYVVLTDDETAAQRNANGRSLAAVRTVSSDPDGFLTLDVPARQKRQVAVRGSRMMKRVTLEIEPMEPGESREIEVLMTTRPDLRITGKVVRSEDGAPLTGVEAHVVQAPPDVDVQQVQLPPQAKADAITDATGTFTVEVRSWKPETVILTAMGRGAKLVYLGPGRDSPPLEQPIALARAAALTGTLSAPEGLSLEGASVVVDVSGHDLLAYPPPKGVYYGGVAGCQCRAAINPGGSFRVPNVPGDVPFKLTVQRGSEVILRETRRRRIASGEASEVALRVVPTSSVSGIVLDGDGAPAEDVEIWLAEGDGMAGGLFGTYDRPGQTTRTAPDGRFLFEGVSAGSWKLGLAPFGRRSGLPEPARWAPECRVIELAGEPTEQAFTLVRGLYLKGRLLTPDGRPVTPEETVYAVSGTNTMMSSTDAGGNFSLGPLLPGSWSVHGLTLRAGDRDEGRFLAPSAPLEAVAGGAPFDLFLRTGACLTLTALDAETGEVVPVAHTASRVGEGVTSLSAAETLSVALTGLVPGQHMVAVHAEDGRVAGATFRLEPLQELTAEPLVLRPGGAVEVAYSGPAPFAQLELIADGVIFDFATVRPGSPQTLRGPVGKAQIRVYTTPLVPAEKRIDKTHDAFVKADETAKILVGGVSDGGF